MWIKQIYKWFCRQESTNEEQPLEQPPEQLRVQFQQQSIMSQTALSRLPTLRFGDTGDSVRALQRLLGSNGYPVRIDGSYGALTETAVKAFQSSRGLRPDGIVGQRTWRALTS